MSLWDFIDKHPVLTFLLVVVMLGALVDVVTVWRGGRD